MEVSFSTPSEPIRRYHPRPASELTPGTESTPDFRQAAALNAALQAEPATRSAAIERGRALASDVNYPPLETIRRIAALLVARVGEDSRNP